MSKEDTVESIGSLNNEDIFEVKNMNVCGSSTFSNSMTYIKIENYKKFLNSENPFITKIFSLYCPAIKKKIHFSIILIPSQTYLSIKIEFSSEDGKRIDFFHFNQNEIIINLSIYSQNKKSFINSFIQKFNVYNEQRNDFIKENYIKYDKELWRTKSISPFILKIQMYQRVYSKISNNFVGIKNEGNTCYFNSIVQTIFNIPILREYILNFKTEKEDKYLFFFQKILYQLQKSNEPIFIYKEIKNTNLYKLNDNILGFIDKNFNFQSQQDVQEILSYIIEYFSNLNNKNSKKKISDFFEGKISNIIECDKINYKSEIEENFLFLSIDCDSDNILKCIENFLKEEKLTGENALLNEKDKKKYDAVKKTLFKKLPPILFFHLKRFTNNQHKICNKIEYQDELNMSIFTYNKNLYHNYCLYSVIVHDGFINVGHYYVYCKNFILNQWFKFNDDSVYEINNLKEVFDDNFGGIIQSLNVIEGENNNIDIIESVDDKYKTAYILCYVAKEKINEFFTKVKFSINKDLENKFLTLPNQTSIMDFLKNGKFSKKNINHNNLNTNEKENLNSNVIINNINSKNNEISYSEYAEDKEEEEKMLKEAINRSLYVDKNENKKEENLDLSISLKKNKFTSSKIPINLKANLIKQFKICLIDNMKTNKLNSFICILDITKKNTPNEIINSLLNNDEFFKNSFQNKIEKLKLIHLNSFQLLINVYNCFDEETELREIICSDQYNKFLYLYLFDNSEYYYSIQIYNTRYQIIRLPLFIFTNEQYNTIKKQNKGNNFFEILSEPNEIKKSKDINSIKMKAISEDIMEYKKIKKLIIKVF